MKKLRTTSWFLLGAILLVLLVNLVTAQEAPGVADRVLEGELPPGTALVREPVETQSERLSSKHQTMVPALPEISLVPMTEGEKRLETGGMLDSSGVDFPNSWQRPAVPTTIFPSELEPLFETESLSQFSGLMAGVPQHTPSPSAVDANCSQLLVNTKFDPAGNFVDPWEVGLGFIYSTTEAYTSPQHSILFADNDVDDPSPKYDLFSQTVKVPTNLISARIDFSTLALNVNDADLTIIALWTVDAGGNLQDIVDAWRVTPDLENEWQAWFLEITDNDTLQQMQGRNIALSFSNETTESPPNEIVFFDDVTFNACQPDPPSRIVVKKVTEPAGAAQKFTFDPSWSSSNFQLSDGQSKTSPDLDPGTYAVKELAQSGWTLKSVTCSDGSNPGSISLQKGETVTCTFRNEQVKASQSCGQLLVNTELDIVEFGDGTGTAEPWVTVHPIVWYTQEPTTAFDGYSLFIEDGDADDPDPTIDMFAQGFQMPANLSEFKAEFLIATLGTNVADEAYGELWLLDEDWVLHLDEPETYYVAGWDLAESEGAWIKQTATANDAQLMKAMSGQKMAILFFNVTDNGGSKESVYFDNVTLTACSETKPSISKGYMPLVMAKHGKVSGPVCNPPGDNPLDEWHSNRGLVQTGASCDSTLSSVDIADYYTFRPNKSGNHILRLSNLPPGSEWAAMIFIDRANPDYAPGSADDGRCRITQPGSGDKQVVCNLNQNTDYFVKVSAGSTPMFGSYKMRITTP